MQKETIQVSIFDNGQGKFTIEGDKIILEMYAQMGRIEPDDIFVRGRNTIVYIPGNETIIRYTGSFTSTSEEENKVVTGKLPVIVSDGSIEYVQTYYDNLPNYYPYYAMTNNGDVYQIDRLLDNDVSFSDELLNFEEQSNEENIKIRNIETGLTLPVEERKYYKWFSVGKLTGCVRVER